MSKRVVTLIGGSEADLTLEWGDWRKKPVVVLAAQVAVPFRVETLEGTMEGAAGDWLLRGVEDELYPCKDSIFRATHEKV